MIDLAPPRTTLIDASAEARPVRRAATVLDTNALALGAALRRAVPFLVRRGVPVAAVTARAASLATVLGELQGPTHVTQLATDPGGWRAALVIDGPAAAYLIEGLLGGDGTTMLELPPKGLSAAQSAIVGRAAHRVIEAFSTVLTDAAGFGFTKLPHTTEGPPASAILAALTLGLGEVGEQGSLTLLVAKEALLASAATPAARAAPIDQRVTATLHEVELELVVELGRITMTLGELAALRIGDSLRLDAPIDGTVDVRVAGQTLLVGRPTTCGSRLAVRVEKQGS